jgi:hypothetical protein
MPDKEASTLVKDLYRVGPESPRQEEPIGYKSSTNPEPKNANKTLYSWKAPERPFKTRNREFWVTTIAMAAVVGLVLFLVEGFAPVLLIISLVFLFYVLSTVPPREIEYEITDAGIKIAEKLTIWDNMNRFWTTRRFDSELLVIEIFTIPGRLELVLDSSKKEQIIKELSKFLSFEKVSPSGLDKAANWLGKKMPGN